MKLHETIEILWGIIENHDTKHGIIFSVFFRRSTPHCQRSVIELQRSRLGVLTTAVWVELTLRPKQQQSHALAQ